ncbi:hypothetical protein J3B02_005813, partial [Coemansia erecta]
QHAMRLSLRGWWHYYWASWSAPVQAAQKCSFGRLAHLQRDQRPSGPHPGCARHGQGHSR